MFCIVEIDDEAGKSVEVVPNSWLTKADNNQNVQCCWPPVKNPTKLVTQLKEPEPNWSLYAARVLRKYETFQRARIALPRAQYTSDWSEVDETPKRKRVSIPRRKVLPQQESSEEELSQQTRGLKTFPVHPPLLLCDNEERQDDFDENGVTNNEDCNLFGLDEIINAGHIVQNEEASPSVNSCEEKSQDNDAIGNDQNLATQDSAPILELLRKLVLDVAVIKRTVQNIDGRLQQLEKGVEPISGRVPDKHENLVLHPFKTLAEFQEFDDSMDKEKMESLKVEILKCGGDSAVEFVGRALKKLLTNEVGLDYSLWGFKNNLNFSKTAVWAVLKEAALSIRRISPTEKTIEKAASEWFRHCGDRIRQTNKKLRMS
ncbi:unnamed protein product [Orchesella dallaii]|uniref:DUF4806 domain-containing protein n=1 Tax=Orchesella dallaii TaxID=48710 RepID=A0ABP1Q5L8_9HEXA